MRRIRFLSIGLQLCSTLPSDPASRRRPCASLILRHHQAGWRTFASKLSIMLGTPKKPRGGAGPVIAFGTWDTECDFSLPHRCYRGLPASSTADRKGAIGAQRVEPGQSEQLRPWRRREIPGNVGKSPPRYAVTLVPALCELEVPSLWNLRPFDRPMTEPALDSAGVVPLVGEGVAAAQGTGRPCPRLMV
jgi:hypothetical protein